MKMSNTQADRSDSREELSALADGELSGDAVRRACALWRDDSEHRSTWHAYQLIGDVMRSEDLACDASADRAFLGALRTRLAAEPVVLAPVPTASAEALAGKSAAAGRTVWRTWRAPAAVAAGFVAVAGVLVVMRGAGSLPGAEPAVPIAQAELPAAVAQPQALQQVAVPAAQLAATEPSQGIVANGQLIRDAQLDRYLAAHKQFAGSSALGVPSAFLRSATANGASR
jgi:sigma-E factor negative regulatory protein RseA